MGAACWNGIGIVARTAVSAGLLATVAARVNGLTVPWSSAAVSFTPYAGAGLAGLAAWSARRGEPRRAALLGAGAVAAAAVVAPRLVRSPQPAAPGGRTVRVTSANCLKGAADAHAVVELVRRHRPDVLALQEQNPRFLERLEAAGLFDLLPHRVVGDGGRLADGAVISRHPLRPIAPDLPSEYVAATVDLPGGPPVPFICAHPMPPTSPRYEGSWIRCLARLPAPGGPAGGGLVAGDFNASLDHPQFRALLAKGWRDAGSEMGRGLHPTWGGRGLLRLTIDHVLAPPGSAVTDYRVDRLRGSDHRAITATIVLPPAADAAPTGISAR